MTARFLLAIVVITCPGCLSPVESEDVSGPPPCRSPGPVSVAPGEKVQGYDPHALLDPFFGTWSGPLAWHDGTSTELAVTVERTSQPIYRIHCDTPPGVYTDALVRLETADGALRDQTAATVMAVVPGVPTRDQDSGVFLTVLSDPQWQGSVADKIPGLERYARSHVFLEFERAPETLDVVGGVLTFAGEISGVSRADTFLLATWRVE